MGASLKRLWSSIARFAEALDGMDDPTGDYMFSLGTRVEKLERDLKQFETRLHSNAGGAGARQTRLISSGEMHQSSGPNST
jgi:hypothetical protein